VTVFGALVPKRLQGSGCGRALGMLCGCCAWRVAPGVVAAAVDVRLWACGTHPTPCWISSSCLAPDLLNAHANSDSAPTRLPLQTSRYYLQTPRYKAGILPGRFVASTHSSGFVWRPRFLHCTYHPRSWILLILLGCLHRDSYHPSLFVQNTNPGLSRHATSSLSTSVGAGHSTINDLATQVCDGRFHSAILSGQTR
jgi:hypothetical protein